MADISWILKRDRVIASISVLIITIFIGVGLRSESLLSVNINKAEIVFNDGRLFVMFHTEFRNISDSTVVFFLSDSSYNNYEVSKLVIHYPNPLADHGYVLCLDGAVGDTCLILKPQESKHLRLKTYILPAFECEEYICVFHAYSFFFTKVSLGLYQDVDFVTNYMLQHKIDGVAFSQQVFFIDELDVIEFEVETQGRWPL